MSADLTALRELYAADRAARTAAHPPRPGSCRYLHDNVNPRLTSVRT